MAVEKVEASIGSNNTILKKDEREYTGNLKAPEKSKDYDLSVKAYDDAGNTIISKKRMKIEKWRPPKTDWKQTDRFNISDYNRIKNNLEYLHEKASELYGIFKISDMGHDIEIESDYWEVDKFNFFEDNLEKINKSIFVQDLGETQRFYPNGAFIGYIELNRIENATLKIKSILDRQKNGIKRIPFRLGDFKGVKI